MWKIVIKVAVVVLILKEAWLLLQIPSVADAIFSFIMVGAVPGTDKTLTPDQMIQLLVGIFILSVALIFHKDLYRLAKRLMKRGPKTEAAASEAVETPAEYRHEVAPVPEVVVAAPEATPKQPSAFAQRMTATRVLLVGRYNRLRSASAVRIRQWVTTAKPVILQYAHRTGAVIQRAVRITGRILWITYIVIIALAMQAWSWMRPRLQRFDRWLDKKLHQNEYTAGILAVGKDIINAYRKALTDIRTSKEPADK